MKEETAVEWYSQQHLKLLIKLENKELSIGEYAVQHQEILNKAKELEKEQEFKKWIEAWSLGYDSGFNNCMKKFNNKQ
jgi:hypothetical protein